MADPIVGLRRMPEAADLMAGLTHLDGSVPDAENPIVHTTHALGDPKLPEGLAALASHATDLVVNGSPFTRVDTVAVHQPGEVEILPAEERESLRGLGALVFMHGTFGYGEKGNGGFPVESSWAIILPIEGEEPLTIDFQTQHGVLTLWSHDPSLVAHLL